MNDFAESGFKFSDEQSGCSVIIDDDGRVAYAYFLDPDGVITGDVWLYNRCETPETPEWTTPDNMPFANPAGYVKRHENFEPVDHIAGFSVEWDVGEHGRPIAFVFIRDELWAALEDRAKPGWCIMAAKDGPLAKTIASIPLAAKH